jgi:isoamylase
MDRGELLRRYAAGERDFTGADLRSADLSNCDLRGAKLVRAQLHGANLCTANLQGADFSGAGLDAALDGLPRVNLKEANLDEGRFDGADLSAALLQRASLKNAHFANARLGAADFAGADLSGADFTGAAFSGAGRTIFQGANLTGAILANGDLTNCLFDGAQIANANLQGAKLPAESDFGATDSWGRRAGSPWPLGATWARDGSACNFALFSVHAKAVTLLLYSGNDLSTPAKTVELDSRLNRTNRIWHARVSAAELASILYYAYQVDGPSDEAGGHRFDAQRVLFDPYARTLFYPPGFEIAAASRPGSNAGRAILGFVPGSTAPFDWAGDQRPVHRGDMVIYELHVKGFTVRPNAGVSEANRGTYLGLIEKIPYLKGLGVTAVELLPVYHFEPEKGGNYWGYMPLSFFCPHQHYSRNPDVTRIADEFRTMVKAMHAAGIEVILDVVYNHTAEGDKDGAVLSYRGIDDTTYYLLNPDISYRNDSGTGNVFRTAHPAVRQLVLDSLRYWVTEMHVDGFRFDLATIFSRNQDGSINLEDPSIISEISSDPDFAGIRLIAEPWDLATYQLGRSFPGISWAQWNGRFRDDVRSFVKGDRGLVPSLMRRLYGSDDLFPDSLPYSYLPSQSVNFITAHDGFCLYDLVSYNQKYNQANGHGNTDGTDDNRSWNCGWEGDVNAPAEVLQLRRRQIKNFCCLLMLSNGTPMFCAGDEFLNTQGGNNNPYNQDNETTWLDWDLLQRNADMFRFFKLMIAFRKSHAVLASRTFWRERVQWYGVDHAGPDFSDDSHAFAFQLTGDSICTEDTFVTTQDIYVMVNAYWESLEFRIQADPNRVIPWKRVVDTSLASPDDIAEPGSEMRTDAATYAVQPRSIVVLIRG